MIQPSFPDRPPLLFTHPRSPIQPPDRFSVERPVASLAAPQGAPSELLLHHRLIDAAEREFARLMVRIEPLLQPLA